MFRNDSDAARLVSIYSEKYGFNGNLQKILVVLEWQL